jgi:tRNA threonylcarbamoyladenosine biosynthesis protein TsaE
MHSVVTLTVAETEEVGARLAGLLVPGDFVALLGDLGAGKTCFARGVAAGLAVDPGIYVTSPTYTLMNVYPGRLPLYHFDLYRICSGDTVALGFDEYFHGAGVCLVEWAERLAGELPEERLEVSFVHEEGDRRRLDFVSFGERYHQLLGAMFPAS